MERRKYRDQDNADANANENPTIKAGNAAHQLLRQIESYAAANAPHERRVHRTNIVEKLVSIRKAHVEPLLADWLQTRKVLPITRQEHVGR